jgi:hypothetical protein
MRLNVFAIGLVLALLGLGGGLGSADGAESDRGVFELGLSTRSPGAATGLDFHIVYRNPTDPGAKPPAIKGAVFTLPAGTRIDGSAVPQCTATDEELRLQGRDACPAGSRVGTGKLEAMTGFPGVDPLTADVVAFNGAGEIIEVVFVEGTNNVAGMDRLTVEGRTLTAHPPATPGGPPDGRTAVREIRLSLPARRGGDGSAYVTAPGRCLSGRWMSRARYVFEDGGETTLTSSSSCRRPQISVAVRPKRLHAGERRILRVVARSSHPTCARRALVRLGERRVRTNAHGRAALPVRFKTGGLRKLVVSKRGCRPARAAVRVLPR